MPLLDVAIPQHSLRNRLVTSRVQPLFHVSTSNKFTSGKEKRLGFAWFVSIHVSRTLKFDAGHLDTRGALLVKAVSTFEPKYLVDGEDGQMDDHNLHLGPHMKSHVSLSPGEDSALLDERERLRRMRISKANKGNVPWNKGRKHSAETLRRIKERTKLAMQDPKVKMKLTNLGHAQSEETRMKIGVGVRIGWQRRREKLLVQETCNFEWQNLIAEASREGYSGEEELHWDSYRLLDEKLAQEWLESIEQRKQTPRPKGSKRAPKSLEQRRKISEAISAKWADLGYRERVCSGLYKYHGIHVGAERKPRRKPVGKTQSVRNSPVKKKVSDACNGIGTPTKSQSQPRLKRSSEPSYKDPSANSKLELIKNIRAQRASMETKKREAMERAKLLIVEAEKAAMALEVAAARSPLAQASVLETRKLIAEATKSLEDIEAGQVASRESANCYSSADLNGLVNDFVNLSTENGINPLDKREVNGTHVFSSNIYNRGFNFGEFSPTSIGETSSTNVLNSEEPPSSGEPLPSTQSHETRSMLNSLIGGEVLSPTSNGSRSSRHCLLSPLQLQNPMVPVPTDEQVVQLELNGVVKYETNPVLNGENTRVGTSEKASTSALTKKKKWVCGRLVEVDEQD
ncbi:uncharacterized protein LOC122667634 isoform X2 [Telopea speciosissima]|uniref:uncharacterized protein LOC122667634 isoform X2 n=1 Tax=Telopea speciosissima TaxID=54955 RepID=UPI001CC3CE12|nr:uncharacterized protein LOC122667634 isoform X2 [Telopea speciosissima]